MVCPRSHGKVQDFLYTVKMEMLALTKFLHFFHSKSQMPLVMKVVSLEKITTFVLDDF
jgi:hypothetical protein